MRLFKDEIKTLECFGIKVISGKRKRLAPRDISQAPKEGKRHPSLGTRLMQGVSCSRRFRFSYECKR
jgi:hypothetical protein